MLLFRRVLVSLAIVGVGSLICYEPAKHFPLIFFPVAVIAVILMVAFSAFSRKPDPKRDEKRGWRVGHIGRDAMFYEEWRDGVWQRFTINGEMLSLRASRAHHAISLATTRFPDWAEQRRGEIISRIKSEFRTPDYEYVDA